MIDIKKLYNKKGGEPLSIAFPEFICGFRQVTPAYQVRDTRVIHVAISSVWSETGKEAEVKIYRTPVARLYLVFSRR